MCESRIKSELPALVGGDVAVCGGVLIPDKQLSEKVDQLRRVEGESNRAWNEVSSSCERD